MIKFRKIHFIGIGGIGNSSIAQILHAKGKKISGSDNVETKITKDLQKTGIKVLIGHDEKNIDKTHDLVVFSPAIPDNNPELKKAKKLKIKTLSYPQALGEFAKDYFTVAIAGTHGKSTTTALCALVLKEGGLDPTVVIGTKMPEFKNQNYRIGKSEYLVIEACEYKDSFLNFKPDILIVTNIEADHLDYFKNLSEYKNSFLKLADQTKESGGVIIDIDDKNSKTIANKTKATTILLSSEAKKAHYHLFEKNLFVEFDSIKIEPGVPGEFNVKNAAFAAALGNLLQIDNTKIEKAIRNFKGTWRRLEKRKTKLSKTEFIDDYAHHPTEIKATLAAIRQRYPKKKILCIYQPHQYNRTHKLLSGFATSFSDVDEVIVPNIYHVRDNDTDMKKASPQKLVAAIAKHHKKVSYGHGIEKTAQFIRKNHSKYDLIITMGAGPIDEIYKFF